MGILDMVKMLGEKFSEIADNGISYCGRRYSYLSDDPG